MHKIALALLKEIAMSVLGKLAFRAIGERLATRVIIHLLDKLAKKYPDNEVTVGLVEDIKRSLKGKRLAVMELEA